MKIANRNTFLIDPQGKIAKVWTKVTQHHSEEVLAAIADELKKVSRYNQGSPATGDLNNPSQENAQRPPCVEAFAPKEERMP
jgi:alkyl hydroperoxide reductase subunit AhpC